MAMTPRAPGDPALFHRLRRELEGDVLFDAFSRGRYSTDASIYQIEPIGIVVPKREEDLVAAIAIAADEGVPILPRGGGTSQCGQSVGPALVIDCAKHLNQVLSYDAGARKVVVQPGLVLDTLNRRLKADGLFFPVDVSTGNRATLGGMAGNNSCGARSIRYGNMVHNVAAIDAILADGTRASFGPVPGNIGEPAGGRRYRDLIERLRAIAAREADEMAARLPKLLRRVGGYNLDSIAPEGHNMAEILVGSEGTLAAFSRLELDLQPLPAAKTLGVCHFPRFRDAMATTQHIVALGPCAVELVDDTMLALARDNPLFRPVIERFVKGRPAAVLLVEFAGEDAGEQRHALKRLGTLLADHGFADAVVDVIDDEAQAAIWDVRKQALNIMMSMKGDGKPVSFIEDCAVRLEDLADYTERLTAVFEKHGTTGTWYAHASVGCLHVRPILNLKDPGEVKKMRAIAEEAFAMVREYKGSHSGEHGDGLVRSEFHRPMFGDRLADAFVEVKQAFDPAGLFNPGKIVDPPTMDDRSLFRFKPGYRAETFHTGFDWSAWHGFSGAIEMCNNNGACRKADVGVMCPSYRVTGNEKDLTRGRANTLRLAVSGQLGPDALSSDEMADTLALCVACKGCRRECPTGVDMARMKSEALYQRRRTRGTKLRERIVAGLPAYAPLAAAAAPVLNAGAGLPGMAMLLERTLGFSAARSLPRWRRDPFRAIEVPATVGTREVALFVDTFNTWFEPENARAAVKLLRAAGCRVHLPRADDGGRPLCCGRTWLAAGDIERARAEIERSVAALAPFARRGVPVLGLEPSCLFTFKDEALAIRAAGDVEAVAEQARLLDGFVADEVAAGRLALRPLAGRCHLHGHCHQKAFGAFGETVALLNQVPELEVEPIESSCCGMAGAFGYQAEHHEVSLAMAELSLFPALRQAGADDLVVANGTSCRHQIADGLDRPARHAIAVIADALIEPEAAA